MSNKLVAVVVFSGDLHRLDVDQAAIELQRAGYTVTRLPDRLAVRLAGHVLDDFVEAIIAGPDDDRIIDAIMCEIDALVGSYGGLCVECGPMERDHVPFAGYV